MKAMKSSSLQKSGALTNGKELLDDKAIRPILVDFLSKKKPQPEFIKEELTIHNRNAIADVVAFYKEMHCFEIKGETDSISRVLKQAIFYNLTFPKITLVTTTNHVAWVTKNAPEHWGILLAKKNRQGRIYFSYFRKSTNNPFFDKEKACLMLRKSELITIGARLFKIKSNFSREDLSKKIKENTKKEELLNAIHLALKERKNYF